MRKMVLVNFLEREATINAAVGGAILEHVQAAVRHHHPGTLTKDKCHNRHGDYMEK